VKCPFCGFEESKVTDSRNAQEINSIRRRRECLKCFKRFTTFETVDLTFQVKKRDGTYEDFQQDKLIRGLEAACSHTKISKDQIREMVYLIMKDLMDRPNREVSTTELGDLVMEKLQEIDMIAYIRFACVYKRFKEVTELMDAIRDIAPKDERVKTT